MTESILVVARGSGERGMRTNRYRSLFVGVIDKNVLEFDIGDGCTTL